LSVLIQIQRRKRFVRFWLIFQFFSRVLKRTIMITEVEFQVLDWIYQGCCSKIMQLPFYWENGKIFSKSKHGRTYNGILICVLLLDVTWTIKQILALSVQRNINGSIIQAIHMVRYLSHMMLRNNIRMFKTDLIQVVNQSLNINSTWGNDKKLIWFKYESINYVLYIPFLKI